MGKQWTYVEDKEMVAKPFLSHGASEGELCILCNSYIKENENFWKGQKTDSIGPESKQAGHQE